jgi:type II secretory pathway component PulM
MVRKPHWQAILSALIGILVGGSFIYVALYQPTSRKLASARLRFHYIETALDERTATMQQLFEELRQIKADSGRARVFAIMGDWPECRE